MGAATIRARRGAYAERHRISIRGSPRPGFVVGGLVGQTGVGGGSLMTPLLVLAVRRSSATAVGTDLLFASVTKSAGTLVHGMNKTVDWRVTGRLALAACRRRCSRCTWSRAST